MLPKIRKAIIPAAGFGTRLFPATKVLKKEFFPIIDSQGKAKPAILAIVEEALSAGIEAVGIIVQECDRTLFSNFFHQPPADDLWCKLKPQQREYSEYLQEVGSKISLISQTQQEGFGHAVYCGREWVDGEAFLLLLGDTIYCSQTSKSCAEQIVAAYQQTGKSAIGLAMTPGSEIHHYGCIMGSWQEENKILSVSKIHEKPSLEYARRHLQVSGMAKDSFLSVFGMYAMTATIFDYLEASIRQNQREGGEFQLTSCLDQLQQDEGMVGYLVEGTSFDIGLPAAYRQTMINY